MSTVPAANTLEALLIEVSRLAVCIRGLRDLTNSGNGSSGGVAGVLQALGLEESQTVPEIARQRHTSRQNVQVVVNRLRKTGLVELEGNPAHKRSAMVRLTEQGKAALKQVQQAESRRLELLIVPKRDSSRWAAANRRGPRACPPLCLRRAAAPR